MCIDSLQIGTIEALNTAVYVQFQDIITGRIEYIQATSDANGIVTADVSDIKQFLSPDFFYAVSILPPSLNQCDAYPFITYGASEEITCAQFQLINTGIPVSSATLVLQADQGSLLSDPNTCISIGFGSSKLISELPYNVPTDDDLIPFYKVVGGITSHMKVSDLPGSGMSPLPSAQIFVGNASNVAAAVAMTGAIAIDNTGLTTLDISDTANITGLLQPDNLIGEPYVIGDLLVASSASELSRFAIGPLGYVLASNGAIPVWTDISSAFVPPSRQITINGEMHDLSANSTYTITTTGTPNRISVSGNSTDPIIDIDATYAGQTSITTLGTIVGTAVWNATAIAVNHGGTNFTSYVIGDILAANTTTSLTRIADVALGNALISGGVGVLPAWGKINLSGASSHVTGTLAKTNGGWGSNTAFVSTGIAFASSSTVATTSSKLKWNDATATLTIDGGTDSILNMNGNSVLNIGDAAADTRSDIYVLSNNGNRALNLFSNGTHVGLNVIDTPGDFYIQANGGDQAIFKEGNGLQLLAGGIKTIQPSANGAGVWKLGKFLNATGISAVAGKVVEIDIDGVIHYFQPVNATIV